MSVQKRFYQIIKIHPDNRVKLRLKRLLSRHKTVKAIRKRLVVSFFNRFGGAEKVDFAV